MTGLDGLGGGFTENSEYHSTFEEYRYDALGRRILTRARRDGRNVGPLNFPALCQLDTLRLGRGLVWPHGKGARRPRQLGPGLRKWIH